MHKPLSKRRALAALALSGLFALVGCGGGGGGGGSEPPPTLVVPPTTPATLGASTTEAAAAAQGAAQAAAKAVELYATLGQGPLPVTAQGGVMARVLSGRVLREQPQARETLTCSEFLGVSTCTGTVTIDTNVADSGIAVPGTYVAIIFNGLQATVDGDTLSLDGTMRIDFLTTFDLNSSSFANQRMELTLDDFAGSADGVSFGPYNVRALIEYDANEVSTLTIDGVRISGLENIVVNDGLNYGLTNVALRRAVWSSATAYVDYAFDQWNVAAGRPTVGSGATISAGTGSIAVEVTASSSTLVVYAVTITLGGVSTNYTVTAAYPVGGGAPTYTAVPAGG
jgi:hypothetical protein